MSVGDRRCYKSAHSSFVCLCLSLLLAVAGCGGSSSGLKPGGPTKVLTAIAATPGTADIAVGAIQQFSANATYSDGSTADVTTSATWTDANGQVATITASGIATAVAAGSTKVTAAMGGLTGSATLTVAAAPKTLTSIAVSPATATIAAGATQQFTATATYSDNSTADVSATAAWTSSAAAVATISSSGLATAVATGSTTITATVSGVSGTAALAVPAPPKTLTSIAVTPPAPTIAAGATQQFAATATYSDGTTAPVTTTVTWTSTNPAVATINAAGLATAVAAGSTTVTAALSGVSGTATLAVTPILSSIAVTPNPAGISAGATQQFTATATYSDNSTKDVTATASWKSANTAVAIINPTTGLARGVVAGSTTVTATLNGTSGSATLNVTAVSITPSPASFAVGATQQFTATAKNPDGSTTDITATANWASANPAVATVVTGGLATGAAAGSTTITASLNGLSSKVTVTVTLAGNTGVSIPTWHVDNYRSGLNPNETSLTPSNVGQPGAFGKLFSYLVDSYAYAEPLLMSNITIGGTKHNVLYVATENDSVYAFDADTYGTGAPLWQVSLLQSGETPVGGTVKPYQGITSTPVIDPSTNTIYVVSEQTSSANGTTYRLNALDITTGAPKHAAVTIQASVPGTNSTNVGGTVSLPTGCVQRAALLLANNNVYIGVGSCHSGWLVSYDASSLAQTGVFNASPNLDGEGTYGGAGGVWMGSGGPVADSNGNIYISTGNGPYDPTQGSYGDSILKFSPTLTLLDHFTPEDYGYMNCQDSDLAAGGLLLIPGSGQVIGGGKMGKLYLLNTASMGHEQAFDAGAVQRLFVEQGINGSQPYPTSCTDSDAHGNPLPNGKTW